MEDAAPYMEDNNVNARVAYRDSLDRPLVAVRHPLGTISWAIL